jgi:hypothetical protein
VRGLVAYPLAILAGYLPRRHWESIDLPIANMALASALLNFLGGAALGITGYFEFMARVLEERLWTSPPFMIYVFISYVFVTPRGLFSLYLVASGLVRYGSWFVGEPIGDPVLTLADSLSRRLRTSTRQRSDRNARLALERDDEPDRRYDGAWAGLDGVDFVIVAARRKPGWTKGTWVITGEGWFTLGEPFDRPMPQGLRTVYPLLLQTNTLEVLRNGVSYELPPLRSASQRKGGHYGVVNAGHPAKAGEHQS